MLQIGVTVYCLALWVGIVFGSAVPDPVAGILALLIVTVGLLLPLAPRVLGLLLRSLDLAPNAPPARPEFVPAWLCTVPGAPGTPGTAQPRAPSVV